MLAPHELKNKAFSKAVRGYNTSEVDDHIEFLIEKYTELYRANAELERKLGLISTKLEDIQDKETSIRTALVEAQKKSDEIIKEAEDKAELITGAIRDRCDAVMADFKRRMAQEKAELWQLRTGVLDFKQEILNLYANHIKALGSINVNSLEEIILPNEEEIAMGIFSDVYQAVKTDSVASQAEKNQADLNPQKGADMPVADDVLPTKLDGDDFFETKLAEAEGEGAK